MYILHLISIILKLSRHQMHPSVFKNRMIPGKLPEILHAIFINRVLAHRPVCPCHGNTLPVSRPLGRNRCKPHGAVSSILSGFKKEPVRHRIKQPGRDQARIHFFLMRKYQAVIFVPRITLETAADLTGKGIDFFRIAQGRKHRKSGHTANTRLCKKRFQLPQSIAAAPVLSGLSFQLFKQFLFVRRLFPTEMTDGISVICSHQQDAGRTQAGKRFSQQNRRTVCCFRLQ